MAVEPERAVRALTTPAGVKVRHVTAIHAGAGEPRFAQDVATTISPVWQ